MQSQTLNQLFRMTFFFYKNYQLHIKKLGYHYHFSWDLLKQKKLENGATSMYILHLWMNTLRNSLGKRKSIFLKHSVYFSFEWQFLFGVPSVAIKQTVGSMAIFVAWRQSSNPCKRNSNTGILVLTETTKMTGLLRQVPNAFNHARQRPHSMHENHGGYMNLKPLSLALWKSLQPK